MYTDSDLIVWLRYKTRSRSNQCYLSPMSTIICLCRTSLPIQSKWNLISHIRSIYLATLYHFSSWARSPICFPSIKAILSQVNLHSPIMWPTIRCKLNQWWGESGCFAQWQSSLRTLSWRLPWIGVALASFSIVRSFNVSSEVQRQTKQVRLTLYLYIIAVYLSIGPRVCKELIYFNTCTLFFGIPCLYSPF